MFGPTCVISIKICEQDTYNTLYANCVKIPLLPKINKLRNSWDLQGIPERVSYMIYDPLTKV